MKLDDANITVKCVEVSKCFSNKRVGFSSFDLLDTIQIGNMARFLVNLRQSEFLEAKQVAAIGTALKLDYSIIESKFIPLMEHLDWVNVKKDNNKIVRIEEKIPPLEDVLPELGRQWKENGPTDIDYTSIASLTVLNNRPLPKEALMSIIDVDNEVFDTAMEYGLSTNCLGDFKSEETGEELIWTPYYWSRNMGKALKFLKRQTSEGFSQIEELSEDISSFQGVPVEMVPVKYRNTLYSGIKSGFFPSVGIHNVNNGQNHEYAFRASPQFDLDPKTDIFEKARLIVSSLRHGQYHASVSKIRLPLKIISALRNDTLRPHSHGKIQYSLLALNRICKIEKVPDHGGSYKISLIRSPENLMALNVAERILKGDEPIEGVVSDPEIDLIKDGFFKYSAEARQTVKEIPINNEYNILMECMQGSRL